MVGSGRRRSRISAVPLCPYVILTCLLSDVILACLLPCDSYMPSFFHQVRKR